MVTANQKSKINNTQIRKSNLNRTLKKRKPKRKGRKKTYNNKSKAMNKMAVRT